jgi:hypothetical protein
MRKNSKKEDNKKMLIQTAQRYMESGMTIGDYMSMHPNAVITTWPDLYLLFAAGCITGIIACIAHKYGKKISQASREKKLKNVQKQQ